MNHAPWTNLGFQRTIVLTDQWQTFSFQFLAGRSEEKAWLDFSGFAPGRYPMRTAVKSMVPNGCAPPIIKSGRLAVAKMLRSKGTIPPYPAHKSAFVSRGPRQIRMLSITP